MLLLSLSPTHPNLNPSKKGITSNHHYVLNFLNHAVGNMVASDGNPDKRKFTGKVSVRDCNSVLLTGVSKAWRWPFSVSNGPSAWGDVCSLWGGLTFPAAFMNTRSLMTETVM